MNMKRAGEENTQQMITFGPELLRISLLAFGNGWLVADKPAGMSVHNESGQDLCSLVSAYINEDKNIQRQITVDPAFGVHPVHRLDKETSGVILLAANRDLFRFFSNQFESRQVKKRYLAILHGCLENPEGKDSWGTWRWALGKNAAGRLNPEGSGARLESLTKYRVLDHSAHYTMVEIELLSGRTHQIRRHAKLSGHPVVGDARYGSTRAINYLRRNNAFDRLALHARAITLQISGANKPRTVKTRRIPKQMFDLFENDLDLNEP
ncbi:MAG: RluA family pseudouridine synthase [Syntrophobacteraceae bacterium]